MPATPYKATATDNGPWDASAQTKNLRPNRGDLMAAFAWVDPKGNPTALSSYKFPYRLVAANGTVGPANLKACSAVIGALNGARGGSSIPDSDRQGVYAVVAPHLRSAGQKPPPLDGTPSSAEMLASHMKPSK